jgi:hypothetical protein
VKLESGVRFFTAEYPVGFGVRSLRWFWRDNDCDEDIGPFDSRMEAVRDYATIRGDKEAAVRKQITQDSGE